jgi:hypothetical protein
MRVRCSYLGVHSVGHCSSPGSTDAHTIITAPVHVEIVIGETVWCQFQCNIVQCVGATNWSNIDALLVALKLCTCKAA